MDDVIALFREQVRLLAGWSPAGAPPAADAPMDLVLPSARSHALPVPAPGVPAPAVPVAAAVTQLSLVATDPAVAGSAAILPASDRADIARRVVEGICAVSAYRPDAVRPDTHLTDDLGFDSLMIGELVATLPFVGKALSLALFGHTLLVYVSLALVGAVWWLLYRTRFGLRLRAAGENPAMVDAAGVSVQALRYQALALNGVLCSLAGSSLVLSQNPSFIPNMTAGRGYMALAAMIFGKWHPVGALWACLLFGFLDAVAIRLQGVALPAALGGGAVPVQAIQALPYVMTVVLLAGFIGRSRAPKALGVPYVKER